MSNNGNWHDEEAQAAYDEAYAAGIAEGGLAFRERCRDIICAPEAEGRYVLAKHLALETDMTADQARAALASAPADREEIARSIAAGMQPLSLGPERSGPRPHQLDIIDAMARSGHATDQAADEAATADRIISRRKGPRPQ